MGRYLGHSAAVRGRVTRGKTAVNRLRRIDVFTALYDPWVLRRSDGPWNGACVVDLGYGATPATTLEAAERLRRLNPALPFLGVEIDRSRVADAQPWADALTAFRHGGFHLPLLARDGRRESVRLIRAMNVLRQYDERDAAAAHAVLAAQVLPGGLVIEGTSDPTGRIWAVNVLRRPEADAPPGAAGPSTTGGPTAEAVVFGTNWADGFEPARFRAVLPKNRIHRVVPGEPIERFLYAWHDAWRDAQSGALWGPRWLFRAAADGLRSRGFDIDGRRILLDRGILVWRCP